MGKRKRTWRWTASAITAACLLTGIPGAALAAEDVKMTVKAGFEGSYKTGTWTMLQVTLENKGQDFQGRVEVVEKSAVTQPNSGHYGTYTKSVVLPKGTTKQVLIEVPAGYLEQPLNVRLVDSAGKVETSFNPGQPQPMQNQLLVGAISAKDADLVFLTKSAGPGIGDRVYVRQLDGTNVPEKADLLQSVDVLMINHAPKEKLTPEQIDAIKTWVQGGGNLVLSGGDQYAGGAGLFADLSPVTVSGTREIGDLSGLEKLAGQKPNTGKLTVTDAVLKPEAQTLAEAGGMPLLAWQQVGAGKVFYAGYDLSVEPLASWAGNEELWKRIFSERATVSAQLGNIDQSHLLTSMARTASSFPGLVPSMQTIGLAFGVYVLVAGPGLYLFLRRKNRREWAWGLIPVTSVVFAAGIFGFGSLASGGGPVAQTLAQVQLKGENTAEVKAAAGVVVKSGGDYSVEVLGGGRIAPLTSTFNFNEKSPSAQILQEGGKQSVAYQDVEYFTAREAEVTTNLSGLGQVESGLKFEGGRIKGTLVNKSKLDLERIYLVAGASSFAVGDLKAGESKPVDVAYQYTAPSTGMLMHQTLRDRLVGVNHSQFGLSRDIEEERRRSLVEYGLQPFKFAQSEVTLVGFSKTPLDLYTVDGEKTQPVTRSLVTQEVKLDHGTGDQVAWPLGMVRPKLIGSDGNVVVSQFELMLQGGSIDLEYNLKQVPGFVPAMAEIDLDESMYSLLEKKYFNWKSQQWDIVSGKLLTDLSAADLQKYMSPEGKFRVQLQGDSQLASGPYLHFPSVGVKGKVSP